MTERDVTALLLAKERTAAFHDFHKLVRHPETCEKCRESGYGLLLRTVAATLEESDPGAAQALHRAAYDVEAFVATIQAVKASEVVELYGLRWAKDSYYYAAAEALGIEGPLEIPPEHSDPHGPRHQ